MNKTPAEFIKITCPICNSGPFKKIAHRFDSGQIVQCYSCNHIYLNPTLTDDSLHTLYHDYHFSCEADAYIRGVKANYAARNGPYQHVLNKIQQEHGFNGKMVLDVGCGPGCFLDECRRRGAYIKGVDLSTAAASLAKKYFNIDIINKPIDKAIRAGDIRSGGFDMIFAFEVLEHVRRPEEFLRDLFGLLSPGGSIYISTPNFYLFNMMGKSAPVMRECSEHIQFFTPESISKIIGLCEPGKLEVTTVNPLGYGDRKKQQLAMISLINSVWHVLRRTEFFYNIKNAIFNRLNTHVKAEDINCWSGTAIVAIAQKNTQEHEQR